MGGQDRAPRVLDVGLSSGALRAPELGTASRTPARTKDVFLFGVFTDKTKLKLDSEVWGGDLVLNGGAEV